MGKRIRRPKKKDSRAPWTIAGRKELRQRIKDFKEEAAQLFYYPNDTEAQLIDFVSLPAVALNWKGENPLWCQVIGAPGSGKTAHISLLEDWSKSKFVSRLTKNSLISGYRPDGDEDEDPSFLNELDGKLFVVKDFTCILQGPKEERDSVVGQLRDIYDGRASRVFGNIGFQEYDARFNMLLAVTGIIDGFHGVNSQLGERFISRREFSAGRVRIADMAFDNIFQGKFKSRWGDLTEQYLEMIERTPIVPMKAIHWNENMKRRAVFCADFIASCRSHVQRERDGRSIASMPSPEVGSRLVTQVVQTVAGYCILNGIEEVNFDAWDFGGARVLRDTLPTPVSWVLYLIYKMCKESKSKELPDWTIKDLLPLTRLGWRTTDQIINDLYHNRILEATFKGETGRRSTCYRLSQRSYEIIEYTRLFGGFSDEEVDLETLKSRVQSRERTVIRRRRRKK